LYDEAAPEFEAGLPRLIRKRYMGYSGASFYREDAQSNVAFAEPLWRNVPAD
jgi:hypothetical protein